MSVEDVHELKTNRDGFKFDHRARVKFHGSSRGQNIMLMGPRVRRAAAPGPPPVIDPSMKIQAVSSE